MPDITTLTDDLFKRTHHFASGVPFSLRDRFSLFGQTQTGKTTTTREIVRKYLQSYPGLKVYIFDPKDQKDYNSLGRYAPIYESWGPIAPDVLHVPGIQIWHPLGATFEEYEEWIKRILEDKSPSLSVFDEITRLSKKLNGWTYPPSFVTLLREGAGMFHAAIVLAQEVAGSARQILGQATHVLRFKLENAYDEAATMRPFARAIEAGRITGKEPSKWHSFWHSRVDMRDLAREFSDWRAFV